MTRYSFALLVLPVLSALRFCSGASWQQYVRAPITEIVYPKAILSTNGSVSNPDALITNQGQATLSRPSSDDTAPSITLDFGQDVVGFVQVHFAGASDNSPGVRLTFSETVEYLTNISDFTRSDNGDTITPGTDQFAVPSDPVVWTDTHQCLYNGTQVCADGLHGFRYLRIALDALAADTPHTQPNGTLQISAVNVQWYGFLGTPDTYTGFFECSDTQLTQWWYNAAYTNEMCIANLTLNTTDPRNASNPELDGKLVILDGAKRDRDPYSGDIYVSGRTTHLTHIQASLAAKNVLGNLADNQRSDGWIPPASINNYTLPLFDYPLWWVVGSWEYVLYSGDTAYAEKYFPALVNVLDNFYPSVINESSGLLSKGLGVTESYGDYAFLPRSGEVTYYNALYVYALQNAISWASHLSQTSESSRWNATAASISDAINANLWDSAVNAYLDSTNLTTSENQTRHAQDGNGLAVLAGVASPGRAQQALGYISDNMSRSYGNAFYDGAVPTVDNTTDRVYAFISFFELQARFITPGLAASALEEIDRLYGWMAIHDPEITFWEGIGPDGSPYEQGYTSMAHGWSTGIVSLLSNYVLGINPTGPGFRTWAIKPYPVNLQWATGSTRTPYGDLWASWNVTSGGFSLMITAPQGTTGTVSLPIQSGQSIYVDGQKHSSTASADGYATVTNVSSGNHCLSVQ